MAVLITLVWLIALPALGGFTFSKRISSTTSDLTTRRHHWANSWNVVDDHQDELFGIGLGGFPRRYFDNHVGTVKLASYQVSAEGLTSFLKLGSAEFVLSQRVDGTGGRQYLFRAKLRMKEKRQSIMVRLCRKHILYFDSLNCKGVRLKSRRTGSFEPYEVAINAGNLGPKAFVRWPMTLTIGAHGETVDITEVELLDELGRNLVNNGSFTQGTDFWFMTSDYSHLPWHVKNNYLYVLIEQGALGGSLFVILMVTALIRLVRLSSDESAVPLLLATSLSGFALVGLLGSPLDMPRVAMMFYLALALSFSRVFRPADCPTRAPSLFYSPHLYPGLPW